MPDVEFYQLPPPLVEVVGNDTRGVLFAPCSLMRVDKREKVRATHLHACFRYVNWQHLTGASMGHRFGIKANNSARASRLIAEAVREGVITPHDPDVVPRLMRYVPWWAKVGTSRDTRCELSRCAPPYCSEVNRERVFRIRQVRFAGQVLDRTPHADQNLRPQC